MLKRVRGTFKNNLLNVLKQIGLSGGSFAGCWLDSCFGNKLKPTSFAVDIELLLATTVIRLNHSCHCFARGSEVVILAPVLCVPVPVRSGSKHSTALVGVVVCYSVDCCEMCFVNFFDFVFFFVVCCLLFVVCCVLCVACFCLW